jgi:DegV family protein with EDD domain
VARTLVVTDSSACLPRPLADELQVRVAPIRVHVGDRTLPDDGATAALVYEALAAGEAVKSSAPSPGDYLALIEEGEAEGAVVVTPPLEFTAMWRAASLAGRLASRPTTVVDCRTAAAGQCLVVLAAARAAAALATPLEVVHAAEDAARRCEMLAVLDSVGPIGRSGRVPSSVLAAADRAGIHPVFRLRSGAVELVASPRSATRALDELARRFEALSGRGAPEAVVFHALAPEQAEALAKRLGAQLVTEFSPAMGIHTGPGVLGVAFLRPREH